MMMMGPRLQSSPGPVCLLLACLILLSVPLAAQQPLIDCGEAEAGDWFYRGFYIPYYPGETLERVDLFVEARTAGDYTLSLTVRRDTYDGPTLGVAKANVKYAESEGTKAVSFLFEPVLNVSPGAMITFQLELVTTPVENPVVLYAVSGNQSCPVVETGNTNPPLGVYRRQGISARMWGRSAAGPALAENGVVNAASFCPPLIPGGAIARGSIFSLFGGGLGSSKGIVLKYPLLTFLGGISIRVVGGGEKVDALPLFANGNQVNAVMPSNAPLGPVTITLSFNGVQSTPISARVVERSVGLFSARSTGAGIGVTQNFESQESQPINSLRRPAHPGQTVTMWLTGLGPIDTGDRKPPPVGNVTEQLAITVGGVPVRTIRYSGRSPCCAGVDQLVFDVPPDAPSGCYVPVIVQTTDNKITGNAVSMSIAAEGAASCNDPLNPLVSGLGGDTMTAGRVLLSHLAVSIPTGSGSPVDVVTERGVAAFGRADSFHYDPVTSLPPPGSCTLSSFRGDFPLGSADLVDFLNIAPLSPMEAGDTVRLVRSSDNANRSLSLVSKGFFRATLGGGVPLSGFPDPDPEFVEPGAFTINGPGKTGTEGAVGPFGATLNIAAPVVWEGRDRLTRVNRGEPLMLRWTGGNPGTQAVYITGYSLNSDDHVGALFVCTAPVAAGEFTIPAEILNSLPESTRSSLGLPEGMIGVGVVPLEAGSARFTADGLNRGFARYLIVNGATVTVK